jgi:polyisoprenoid-binding protein YceI
MNLKNRFVAIATVAAIAIPAMAFAKYKFSPNKDNAALVTLGVKLTAGSFTGTTADVNVSEDDANYTVTVNMARMNTDMDTRNKHFQWKLACQKVTRDPKIDDEADDKKFIADCEKLPRVAKLVVAKDAVNKKTGIPGKMTINGVTKDVTVHIDKIEPSAKGDRKMLTASTSLKYTDFYKEVCYKVMCVKPDIKVTAKLPIE